MKSFFDFILQTKFEDCADPCNVNGVTPLCDKNANCLIEPISNELICKCKPGFNGTGTFCTGTLRITLNNLHNFFNISII